jgi:hypothetical protein
MLGSGPPAGAIGRSSPGMTKPGARSEAWKRFRYCLPSISGAAFILAVGSGDDLASWLTAGVTLIVVIWDLGSWLKSHVRRQSGGPTAEPS